MVTFFDRGKDLEAKASDLWQMVHRLDFERKITLHNIQKGQVLRVQLKNQFLDFTGFVTNYKPGIVSIFLTTALNEGETKEFRLDVESETEILSSLLFYRLPRCSQGEKA